jgi:GNAT superfamily N-acetyltransferase
VIVLPAGLTHRPLRRDDATAVFDLIATSERALIGTVAIEEADIVGHWSRPSFDIAASTIGVFEADELLGYAEVGGPGRGDASVHPDHLGRGIGTVLAGWMQDTARAQGQDEIGMPVPEGSPGERLLRALGYGTRWTAWVLALPGDRRIEAPVLPDGYVLRIALEEDLADAFTVTEDAFLEWSVRPRQEYADWAATVVGRPGHEPWHLQVVADAEGAIVGAVQASLDQNGGGFVHRVAVRADQRGRGIARALLAAAFGAARERGARRSELSTDSRTGALDLYLGLGMEVESTWVNLGISLVPPSDAG